MNKFIFNLLLNIFYKYISNFVYFLKKKNYLVVKNLKSKDLIIFNRSDRIGDAILSLPFFLSLKEKKINFIVLTSKYNDFILNPFIRTKIRKNFDLDENIGKVTILLKKYLFLIKFRKRNLEKRNFYIDLKGDYELDKEFENFYKIHFKNWNLNLQISDYVINDNYTYLSKKNLIKKYDNLMKDFFNLKLNIEECPKELLNKIKKVKNLKLKNYIFKNYIIVLCSNKNFKNFSIKNWIFFFNNLNYDGKILIIDNYEKNIINSLKKNINFLKNKNQLIFIEEKFNLWELSKLSYNSNTVIGLDGGPLNFLQFFTNSISFMFYSNQIVWRPFSLNNYKLIYSNSLICIEKSIQKNKNKKLVIYNKKFEDSPYYEFYQINSEVYSKYNLKEILKIINIELKNNNI